MSKFKDLAIKQHNEMDAFDILIAMMDEVIKTNRALINYINKR